MNGRPIPITRRSVLRMLIAGPVTMRELLRLHTGCECETLRHHGRLWRIVEACGVRGEVLRMPGGVEITAIGRQTLRTMEDTCRG